MRSSRTKKGTIAAPWRNVVAFDLEFVGELPSTWSHELTEDAEARNARAVEILCAGIVSFGSTGILRSKVIASPTTTCLQFVQVQQFIDHLRWFHDHGWTIVSWGGMASDFRVLHAVCLRNSDLRRAAVVRQLALDHIDMPLCTATTQGHMMGLAAACRAMGVPMEKGPDDSRMISSYWAEDRDRVLRHVLADAWSTVRVFDIAVNQFGEARLWWITRRGHQLTWSHPHFLTVAQCMAYPPLTGEKRAHPPRDRDSCTRWIRFYSSPGRLP